MHPNPTCPVCDHGATDAASIRVHNEIAALRGCRVYPFGRGSQRETAYVAIINRSTPRPAFLSPVADDLIIFAVERPAAWLNREFGAFAPSLAGRVTPGDR